MKNAIATLLLVSIAAIGTTMAAQTPTHQPPTPDKQVERLSKKLALTADQQNQILPILTQRQQQIAALNADASLTSKQRHTQMKSIRTDSEAKIRNVLTDTQRATYDQMQQEARDRAKTKKLTNVSATPQSATSSK